MSTISINLGVCDTPRPRVYVRTISSDGRTFVVLHVTSNVTIHLDGYDADAIAQARVMEAMFKDAADEIQKVLVQRQMDKAAADRMLEELDAPDVDRLADDGGSVAEAR